MKLYLCARTNKFPAGSSETLFQHLRTLYSSLAMSGRGYKSNLLSNNVWNVAQYQSLASAAGAIHLAGTGDVARHFTVAHAASTPARSPDSAVQQ